MLCDPQSKGRLCSYVFSIAPREKWNYAQCANDIIIGSFFQEYKGDISYHNVHELGLQCNIYKEDINGLFLLDRVGLGENNMEKKHSTNVTFMLMKVLFF